MNYNREVLNIDEATYTTMTDADIIAMFSPACQPTALSRKHHEEADAKAAKKLAREEKQATNAANKAAKAVERLAKKVASDEKKRLAAEAKAIKDAEKARMAGMTPDELKAYRKSVKTEKLMADKPKLL